MPDLDQETWGKLVFGLYLLIGLPVAWRFMRQQNMTANAKQSRQLRLVVGVLAAMWPVLLFAMGVSRLQGTGKRSKANPGERLQDQE